MTALRQRVIIAMSWRIAAELARRRPDEFRVYETHPGGGQYDCLSIGYRPGETTIELNRNGSLHIPDNERHLGWDDVLALGDLRAVVDRIERSQGSVPPAHLPSSNGAVLSYRLFAWWLSARLFDRSVWDVRSGVTDTSGYGGGVMPGWFAAFPGAGRRLVPEPGDPFDEPSYRFWFLTRDGDPVAAFEPASGTAWTQGGEHRDLMAIYRAPSGGTVDRLAGAVLDSLAV